MHSLNLKAQKLNSPTTSGLDISSLMVKRFVGNELNLRLNCFDDKNDQGGELCNAENHLTGTDKTFHTQKIEYSRVQDYNPEDTLCDIDRAPEYLKTITSIGFLTSRRPIVFKYHSFTPSYSRPSIDITLVQKHISENAKKLSFFALYTSFLIISSISIMVGGSSIAYSSVKVFNSVVKKDNNSPVALAGSYIFSQTDDVKKETRSSENTGPFSFSIIHQIISIDAEDEYTLGVYMRDINSSEFRFEPLPEIIEHLYLQISPDNNSGSIIVLEGYATQRSFVQELVKKGYRPDLFINPFNIGESGYMNWEDIALLKEKGVGINAMADTSSFSGLSFSEVLFLTKESKIFLDDRLGQYTQFFYYPEGIAKDEHKQAVKEAGFLGGITDSRNRHEQKLNDLFGLRSSPVF